jgi:hypothetical protein
MAKNSEWEGDEYRDFKKPKRVADKDKLGKHRKAIYDMLDSEVDEDYFNDNYLDEDYDEDDERY